MESIIFEVAKADAREVFLEEQLETWAFGPFDVRPCFAMLEAEVEDPSEEQRQAYEREFTRLINKAAREAEKRYMSVDPEDGDALLDLQDEIAGNI